jgi:hypothetical protein
MLLACACSSASSGQSTSSGSGGVTSSTGTTGMGGTAPIVTMGANVGLADLPVQLAAAVCDVFLTCSPVYRELFVASGESCTASLSAQMLEDLPNMEEAVAAGRVAYDGTLVDECVAQIRAQSCEQLTDLEQGSCEAMLHGTTALGAPCTLEDECAGNAYCDFALACPGVCTARQSVGGECLSETECDNGLDCVGNRCVAPGGPGATCGNELPGCSSGYTCTGTGFPPTQTGTCRSLNDVFTLGVGQPCELFGDAQCQPALVCALEMFDLQAGLVSGTCAQRVPSSGACRVSLSNQCPSSEYCATAEDALEGACTPLPSVGSPCADTTFGDLCGVGLRCEAGICSPPAHLGESCVTDEVCLSDRCGDGVCVSESSCQ